MADPGECSGAGHGQPFAEAVHDKGGSYEQERYLFKNIDNLACFLLLFFFGVFGRHYNDNFGWIIETFASITRVKINLYVSVLLRRK